MNPGETAHEATIEVLRQAAHALRVAAGLSRDAVDEIASRFLDSGLPSDKGVRPHVSVIVDAETLDDQPGEAATLVGFGPIGPQLLALLA